MRWEGKMEGEMGICPLMGPGEIGAFLVCQRVRCAWWHNDYKQCSILSIAEALKHLTQAVDIDSRCLDIRELRR